MQELRKSIYLSLYLSIYLSRSLYSPYRPWPVFSLLIYTESVGPLGGGSALFKSATCTQKNTNTE
jgi:hypothetical protein